MTPPSKDTALINNLQREKWRDLAPRFRFQGRSSVEQWDPLHSCLENSKLDSIKSKHLISYGCLEHRVEYVHPQTHTHTIAFSGEIIRVTIIPLINWITFKKNFPGAWSSSSLISHQDLFTITLLVWLSQEKKLHRVTFITCHTFPKVSFFTPC